MIPIERLQDQSFFFWLKSIVPSGVAIVDAFPTNLNSVDTPLTLPTVSIETSQMLGVPFELGNIYPLQDRLWSIDIFGSTKTQRDDLSYLIFNKLSENVPVFDYNEGFPPSTSPTQLGALDVSDIELKPIYVFKDLVRDLYWRSQIRFWTIYRSF
jgi:hypothetical protein